MESLSTSAWVSGGMDGRQRAQSELEAQVRGQARWEVGSDPPPAARLASPPRSEAGPRAPALGSARVPVVSMPCTDVRSCVRALARPTALLLLGPGLPGLRALAPFFHPAAFSCKG